MFWLISASRARLPPSPLLSARMITVTYFSVTMTIIDQNIRLTMPYICSSSSGRRWWPANVSRIAYSGLVPMSPKTTPIAPTAIFMMPV